MKKILSVLLIVLLLVGCSATNSSDKIALSDVETKIIDLKDSSGDYLFDSLFTLGDAELVANGFDSAILQEYLFQIPLINVEANMYLILKPVAGKESDVDAQIQNYVTSYNDLWSTYLPDQYDMVKNALTTTYLGYKIYIVSADNQAVLDLIKTCVVKK